MTDADRIHLQLQSFGTFYAQFVFKRSMLLILNSMLMLPRTSSLEEDDVMHSLFSFSSAMVRVLTNLNLNHIGHATTSIATSFIFLNFTTISFTGFT